MRVQRTDISEAVNLRPSEIRNIDDWLRGRGLLRPMKRIIAEDCKLDQAKRAKRAS